jgi:pimeloyl-ACP methyl ester carboxylesterase
MVQRAMRGARLAAMAILLGATSAAADPLAAWVSVDGMQIRCLESGPADGPVLLMVHGWAGSADDFRPLFALLPASVHAIAVDLPGSGLSDKPDAAYDLPFFLDFLHHFCRVRGLERFVLLGHSMGGLFAVHFTALWPGMVERLVLVAPYGLEGEEGSLRTLSRLGGFVDFGLRLNTRLFIEWSIKANVLYRPRPEVLRAAVDSTARSILGPEGARALARVTTRIIGTVYVDGILPAVDKETLVIWGDRDRVLSPSYAPRWTALLPHARLHVVAECSHMPMLEHPEETAAEIATML